ncbi:MAG: excinuclease ABC subunit UvrC [Candidatus Heimdallarchaeaceae archaeon]
MSLFSDIEQLPESPGVYLIKDRQGKVIYIGKAKNLKERVKQHFSPSSAVIKKESHIQDGAYRVDWLETRTETEAILLERRLIQDMKPKFNIRSRDDKSSLLIRISKEEKFPQLRIVRETDPRVEGSMYFGPYGHDRMLRDTVRLVLKLFPIANCGYDIEKYRKNNRSVRCMRKRLGQCLAPCQVDVNVEEYHDVVDNVVRFLNGDVGDLLDNLEAAMWKESKNKNFERAATLRDLISSVQTILHIQKNNTFDISDMDVIAFREDDNVLSFCRILLREKKVHNLVTLSFPFPDSSQVKTLNAILALLYKKQQYPPIILVEEELKERFDNDVNIKLITPTNDSLIELIDIAKKNVFHEIARFFRTKQYQKSSEELLEEAQIVLRLPYPPRVIHGYDISTLAGQHSTGSCVVFVDGKPAKQLYRRFRIKQAFTDPDDYAMMNEILTRRYTSESLSNDPKPDLIVIDGGKGQFNIAKKVLKKLNLDFPVISIAKKKEEIFVDWKDDSLTLPDDSAVRKLIQHVRDEAHRFALTYSKKLRSTEVRYSTFERIKGIGRKKAQILTSHYKDFKEITNAKVEDITALLKVNEETARSVINLAKRMLKPTFE